jgi:hypothetical protein
MLGKYLNRNTISMIFGYIILLYDFGIVLSRDHSLSEIVYIKKH